MRRWIAGLEPKALPFALVCNILTLLMGVSIATVLVARAQETTNGNAGSIPIISAVCFVAIVVVLWYLSKGRLWARLVISVLSFIAIVFSLIMTSTSMGFEGTIIRLFEVMLIFASLGLSFLWIPLPEREQ